MFSFIGKNHWGIYLILAGGFFIRLSLVAHSLALPIEWDEAAYVHHAGTILQEPRLYVDLFRPPLYPAFVAFLFYVGGVGRFSVGVAQALLSTGSIALVYNLTQRRFSRRVVSLVAAFLCASYIAFVALTRFFLTETLFIALALAAFTLLYDAVHAPRARTAFCAGLLCILAALTREVFIHFVLVVVPVWFVIALGSRRAMGLVIPFFCGVLILLTPWIARNYALEGRFILIGNSGDYTFLRDNLRVERRTFPELRTKLSLKKQVKNELRTVPSAEHSRYVFTRVLDIVMRLPLQWLAYHAHEVRQFWSDLSLGDHAIRLTLGTTPIERWLQLVLSYSPVALILLTVIGMFASKDDAPKLLLLLFTLYTLSIAFITHYQHRFREPLLALALPEAAFGLTALVGLMHKPRTWREAFEKPRVYVAFVVLALFLILIIQEAV